MGGILSGARCQCVEIMIAMFVFVVCYTGYACHLASSRYHLVMHFRGKCITLKSGKPGGGF